MIQLTINGTNLESSSRFDLYYYYFTCNINRLTRTFIYSRSAILQM